MAGEVTLAIAALAGIGSFVAPCVLPMIPAFLAYISGTTVSEMVHATGPTQGGRGAGGGAGGAVARGAPAAAQASVARGGAGAGGAAQAARVAPAAPAAAAAGPAAARDPAAAVSRSGIVLNTAFFVLGFSVVFAAFGALINSVLSDSASGVVSGFNQAGGVIIIAFGAVMLLSTRMRLLNLERRLLPRRAGASYPMSFVFGLSFAAGWTPCVGPVLGTILTLAATTPSAAFGLLLAYSLGLGVPFMLMGVFFSRATGLIRAMGRHLRYYSVGVGSLIVLLGMLVLTGQLSHLASFPLLNELVLLG